MTATENRNDLVSRKPDAIERTLGLQPVVGFPQTLSEALLDLSKVAAAMHPDDVSMSIDLAAGVLTFRAHKSERR